MSRANPCTYQSFVADYYDYLPPVAGRQDLDFYLEVGRTQGEPILELGCGTGRVLLHMAQAGLRVVGLDLSEPMLDRCRAKLENRPAGLGLFPDRCSPHARPGLHARIFAPS